MKTDEDRMQELSRGVQKIFRDAVNKPTPTPSLPVEQRERERELETYISYIYIYISYVSALKRLFSFSSGYQGRVV